ncbi:unnamed protein product [Fusarium graminearum]|uniref:Chromosome 2, complete genome n=1 Tax=Gibberella zeae (strain ATCC MYA-4620 / CBS 123657 / FGSC 9075 / NRRL 31084 / PH-1) TaxID=229533 RepID=A0A098DGK3_GIBZE|nr:unnamed protein product [Fusarium graminearum]CZS81372.1 unnamed protein product [Fusarium graminearum]
MLKCLPARLYLSLSSKCVIVGNESTRAWLGYDESPIGSVRIVVAEASEFFLCRLKLDCFACRAASRGLFNGCSSYRIGFQKVIVQIGRGPWTCAGGREDGEFAGHVE